MVHVPSTRPSRLDAGIDTATSSRGARNDSSDTLRQRTYDAFVRGDICQDLPQFLCAQVWAAVLSKLPPVPIAKEDHHRPQLEHARPFG